MARTFTKYPSGYVKASMSNELPKSIDKIDKYYKDRFRWAGAQLITEDAEGNEWFVVEDESEAQDSRSPYYQFCLVCVYPDGDVDSLKTRRIEKDSYTTEKAYDAMNELEGDYWDFYS